MAKFEVIGTPLEGARVVRPSAIHDTPGWFMETYALSEFGPLGIDMIFTQDNHSFSRDIGTLRGLQHQLPPFAQDKLVRCVVGRI